MKSRSKSMLSSLEQQYIIVPRQHIDREILTEVSVTSWPYNSVLKLVLSQAAYNLGPLGQPVALNKENNFN